MIDATFAVAKIKPEKSRHPFMGFYDTELTKWPAPRWLVCLTGRGAAQVSQSGSKACKKVPQGFEFRALSLNYFSGFRFATA